MNLALICPMFAMVILSSMVALILFISRIKGVAGGHVSMKYYKAMQGEGQPTELMTNAARHFSNLFEVPVLFYAGAITAMVTNVQGTWVLVWAWLFVAARVAHAVIHIGRNKVRPRVLAFFMGFFAVLALWIQILTTVAN